MFWRAIYLLYDTFQKAVCIQTVQPVTQFPFGFLVSSGASCCLSVRAKMLQSCPTLCNPLDCVACQAPLSKGFSRQEYWSGLPFPSPPGVSSIACLFIDVSSHLVLSLPQPTTYLFVISPGLSFFIAPVIIINYLIQNF